MNIHWNFSILASLKTTPPKYLKRFKKSRPTPLPFFLENQCQTWRLNNFNCISLYDHKLDNKNSLSMTLLWLLSLLVTLSFSLTNQFVTMIKCVCVCVGGGYISNLWKNKTLAFNINCIFIRTTMSAMAQSIVWQVYKSMMTPNLADNLKGNNFC